MIRSIRLALAAVIVVPAIAAAQKPLALSKPEIEYGEPFTQISGLRELSDGRVIVADARDKTLQLIDFRSGSSTGIGREGQGPGEYGLPYRLLALPGDTSALYDIGNSRYLTILPDGKTGKDFRLESNSPERGGQPSEGPTVVRRGGPPGDAGRGGAGRGGAGGRVMMGGGGRRGGMTMQLSPPRGSDARGNIYFEGSAFAFGPDGEPMSADSAPVMRFDRGTSRTDTVAWVRLAKANAQASGSGGNVRMVIGGANPLVPRDDWAVLPDGRVAVLRSPEYRLDLYGPTLSAKAGAPAAYEKIRVDNAVKKEAEDARRRAMAGGIRMMVTDDGAGPQRSVSMGGGGGANIELPPLADWPDFVPPFLANAANVRPNGEVWVLRSRKPGDDIPVYDVFDASGRVIGHVALPAKSRLVGFGNATVYLIRLDADDLQYLQRFRLAMDAKLNG
ncbi:MAG: hypothetical protein O2973_01285 [Gemmatimonadetes bacterium]|nr:hypothetical protein [Gemmatimonadota bacterium]